MLACKYSDAKYMHMYKCVCERCNQVYWINKSLMHLTRAKSTTKLHLQLQIIMVRTMNYHNQTYYILFQSAQRPVTNSPDVSHHSNMDKLPPLEQLRASLRKTDSAKSTNSSKHKHRVSIVDEDNIPSYVRLSRPVPVPST